ncbi:MAG: hypothetical protein V3T81_09955 [Thermoanaerobaculia bacterium]
MSLEPGRVLAAWRAEWRRQAQKENQWCDDENRECDEKGPEDDGPQSRGNLLGQLHDLRRLAHGKQYEEQEHQEARE